MTSATADQDPAVKQYDRYWIVGESISTQIYGRGGLEEAIAEFQRLLRNGYSPRFLGEKADDSLHDLSLPKPAISTR